MLAALGLGEINLRLVRGGAGAGAGALPGASGVGSSSSFSLSDKAERSLMRIQASYLLWP